MYMALNWSQVVGDKLALFVKYAFPHLNAIDHYALAEAFKTLISTDSVSSLSTSKSAQMIRLVVFPRLPISIHFSTAFNVAFKNVSRRQVYALYMACHSADSAKTDRRVSAKQTNVELLTQNGTSLKVFVDIGYPTESIARHRTI